MELRFRVYPSNEFLEAFSKRYPVIGDIIKKNGITVIIYERFDRALRYARRVIAALTAKKPSIREYRFNFPFTMIDNHAKTQPIKLFAKSLIGHPIIVGEALGPSDWLWSYVLIGDWDLLRVADELDVRKMREKKLVTEEGIRQMVAITFDIFGEYADLLDYIIDALEDGAIM